MKNKVISQLLAAGLCLVALAACASPTLDQVLTYKSQYKIPMWRNDAKRTSEFIANNKDAMATQIWAELDADVKQHGGKNALTRASNPTNAAELHAYTAWLRWQVLSQNADGRYSFAYAYNLSKLSTPDGDFLKEAAIFFFHAKLALEIDGARCKDKSSADNVIMGYTAQRSMKPLIEKIESMSTTKKAAAALEAVTIEEMLGERPAFGMLCKTGGVAMADALRGGKQFEEQNSGEALGKTYSIDVSGVAPQFVPEEQWRKARLEKLENLTKIFAKDL